MRWIFIAALALALAFSFNSPGQAQEPRRGERTITISMLPETANIQATGQALELTGRGKGTGIRWLLPSQPVRDNKQTHYLEGDGRGAIAAVWTWEHRSTGAALTATVPKKRGNKTYALPYELIGATEPFQILPSGHLQTDGFRISPVVVIDALGNTYSGGPYTFDAENIYFSFNDGPIPPAGLPYVIDPTVEFCEDAAASCTYDSAFDADITATNAANTEITIPTSIDDTSTSIDVSTGRPISDYVVTTGLVSWDTSVLPSDAIITGAQLTLYVNSTVDTLSMFFRGAWIDANTPYQPNNIIAPKFCVNYGQLAEETAPIALQIDITDLTTTADNTFGLDITDNTVDPDGVTTLRFHAGGLSGCTAIGAGGNSNVNFASNDNGSNEPRLTITYIDPVEITTPNIVETLAYQSVVESGDLLFLVNYEITPPSSGLPLTPASDAYFASLAVGTNVLRTQSPVSTSENALLGYEQGLVALHFTADQVAANSMTFGAAGTYTLELESVDYPATTISTTNVTYRAREQLRADLERLGQLYEDRWAIDVLENRQLTAIGQDYFQSAWPFICIAEPEFCSLIVTGLDNAATTFGTSTSDSLDAFWGGVPAAINPKTNRDNLAAIFGMSGSDFMLMIIGLFSLAAFPFLISRGIPVSWLVASVAFIILGFTAIGMVDMAIGITVGIVATLLVVFTLFLRRAAG